MDNILACNLASYGKYQDIALEHLAGIGVRHVEIRTPAPDQIETVKAQLAAHGLSATSLMAGCLVDRPELPELFEPVFAAAQALGAKIIFASAKAGETPLDDVFARLRAVGEGAVKAGVRVALETHPDLCDNGGKMFETMAAINHPGLGVNFDTANIYFYNEGTDAVTELRKTAGQVAAVHLKDTGGGYRAWDFGAIGEGVVDFPEVFAILNARGFHGPFTLELEGKRGEDLSQDEKAGRVAQSVAWLREHGLVP